MTQLHCTDFLDLQQKQDIVGHKQEQILRIEPGKTHILLNIVAVYMETSWRD